jgi:N-methylhydantoinase B/oxoprolinase/acetone carboxylase alpha subunit
VAAVAIGKRRVRKACERYGVALVEETFATILDQGEEIARAELEDPDRCP